MKKIIIIKTEQDMINLGKQLGQLAFPNMTIAVEGTLGAGKTVLAKGIGQGLGVQGVINSPTFTIMKIYPGRLTLYHLDVYRLSSGADDFELEEYFENGGVSYIEWAQNIEELLPDNRLMIDIKILPDQSRKVVLQAQGVQYEKLLVEVMTDENNDN